MEKNGEVVDIFPSIQDASRSLGIHVSTIEWRIRQKRSVKGVLMRYLTEEEEEAGTKFLIDFLNKEKEEQKRVTENPAEKKNKPTATSLEDDVELDSGKYSIIHYETIAGHICVTPCPHLEAPKPKVGSALCLRCSSFHGRNRTRQEVACGDSVKKSWKRSKGKNKINNYVDG